MIVATAKPASGMPEGAGIRPSWGCASKSNRLLCTEVYPFYQGWQFAKLVYLPSPFRNFLSAIRVGGFEHSVHTAFNCWPDILINTVSHVQNILRPLADSACSNLENPCVRLSKIKFVRINSDCKEVQYVQVFQVLLQRAAVHTGIGEYPEFQAQSFKLA